MKVMHNFFLGFEQNVISMALRLVPITSLGFTKGCFSWGVGVCYAFEAEIMTFIIAIERAFKLNCRGEINNRNNQIKN